MADQTRKPLFAAPRIGLVALLRVGVPLAFLIVWEISVRNVFIPARFFPAPSSLLAEIWADLLSGKLEVDTLSSLYRLAWGFSIGVVLGVVIGWPWRCPASWTRRWA